MQPGPAIERPLRAAIYCRISETDDDYDKVAVQERNLRQFCRRQGYAVTDSRVYVDDGVSAFLPGKERPGYKRMLDDAKAKRFDVITATFQDRLTRQNAQVLDLLTICRASGIRWHTIADGLIDPTSEDDGLLAYLRGWVGSREITTRSKRQQDRFEEQRRAGLPLWGNRPFGFMKDRITHHEQEAREIRWAYEQVADGATIYSIIKEWNLREVRTATGKMWSYAGLQLLLKRPRNAGLMEVHGEVDESIKPVWQPIVDRELWELVRAKVTRDPEDVRRQFEPRWLLAGLARCGLCSQPLRSGRGSDRKTSFTVYRCKRGMLPAVPPEFHEDGRKIRHASAKTAVLDGMARDAVVAAFMFAPSSLLPSDSSSASDLRRAQVELSDVRRRLVEVTEELDDDSSPFDRSTLRAKAAKHRQREQELEADMARIIETDANSAMMIESRSAMLVPRVIHDAEPMREPIADPQLRERFWEATATPGPRVSIHDAARLKTELEQRFDALPLRQRRQLVTNLLDVVAYPGRKADRFVVWHKVAKSLNPVGAEPPVFLRPVELAVSVRGSTSGDR